MTTHCAKCGKTLDGEAYRAEFAKVDFFEKEKTTTHRYNVKIGYYCRDCTPEAFR